MRLLPVFSLCASLLWIGCARPENQTVTTSPSQTKAMEKEAVVAEKLEAISSSPLPSKKSVSFKPPSRPTLDERFLFQPSDATRGNYRPADLRFEDVTFQAADGTTLHGWYCPCENPRAYVLFAHGNAGNLSFWSERMAELQNDYRVCVFIFDYRGYGKSEGKPTVTGVLSDARAAARVLADKAGVMESDLVLMGQSLGGAVAVHLAAEIQPRGLILESTFSSFREVADHHAKWAAWLVPPGKLNSCSEIGRYQGPLLQCHGDVDGVVPFASGRKLFQAANEPKTFIVMEGGDHNTPLPRSYRWELYDFFQYLPQKPAS